MQTMYGCRERPIKTYYGKPKQCDRCGGWIGFIQNRNRKYFAINVFPIAGGWGYYGGYGNHGNMKGEIHHCDYHADYYPYYGDRNEIIPIRSELAKMMGMVFEANADEQKELIAAMPHNTMRRILEQFLIDY